MNEYRMKQAKVVQKWCIVILALFAFGAISNNDFVFFGESADGGLVGALLMLVLLLFYSPTAIIGVPTLICFVISSIYICMLRKKIKNTEWCVLRYREDDTKYPSGISWSTDCSLKTKYSRDLTRITKYKYCPYCKRRTILYESVGMARIWSYPSIMNDRLK